MATALKLKNDIKKLKAAISSKATPKSFVPKLKAQLDKAENELASLKKGGRPRKTSTTKGTATTLSALQKLIQKKKFGVYQGAGVDLKKDAGEGAFATGRRVSKGLKSNQWGDASENKGNVYYEYRPNRLDVKQPKKKQTYPKLADGGSIPNNYEGMSAKDVWSKWNYEQKFHFLKDHINNKSNPLGITIFKASDIANNFSFEDLPNNFKRALQDHIEEGQYAKGGKLESGVYRIGKPSKVSQNLYEQKIVEIFDNGDIATASDYGRKMSDFRGNTYPIISQEELEAQYKMAKGGYMAKGGETVPYIIWVSKDGEEREFYGDYKSQRAAEMAMNKLWEKGEYNSMGNKPKSSYEKNGLYAKGGVSEKPIAAIMDKYGNIKSEKKLQQDLEYLKQAYQDKFVTKDEYDKSYDEIQEQIKLLQNKDKGGYMAHGGEVGQGFLIRDMREKLNKMFPDTFGFTVGNISKEGNEVQNSSALVVDRRDPYRGLEDKDIQSKLFFPQYKRDHDIRFRIYQGGENTYFYFLLESENGDQYIGQFGFKDQGDVSSDYVTRFIAFLMEQYGLPFEVKHSVMAKGGYMASGGEMHKADHFKDGGEVFSEKKLKEILDEALGHFYQGLNQVDLAMRYLEVKGQGGLKKPLSNKLKLDDLKESIEKIDEYISK